MMIMLIAALWRVKLMSVTALKNSVIQPYAQDSENVQLRILLREKLLTNLVIRAAMVQLCNAKTLRDMLKEKTTSPVIKNLQPSC